MLDLKVARKMVYDKDLYFDFYLQIYALIYAKIALYHGIDLEVDSDIEEVCNLIAEKIKYNIRELEGAMNRMISFSEIMNNKI